MIYNDLDAAKFIHKKTDFLLKGADSWLQQTVLQKMRDLDPEEMEYLTEKDAGYPKFKEEDFSDEYIRLTEEESATAFKEINELLAKYGRRPFFTDPDDTCRSAKEYLDLMKRRPYQELVELFGAVFGDYEPEVLE